MICPYSNCDGDIQSEPNSTHCKICMQPVVPCPKCYSSNQAFARHCRNCGEPKGQTSPDYLQSAMPTRLNPLTELVTEPRRIELNNPFLCAPILYRGFLWFVSTDGSTHRLSPYDEKAEYI